MIVLEAIESLPQAQALSWALLHLLWQGVVVAVLIAWQVFSMPMLEFAVMVTQFLGKPLFDLGDGWLGFVFLPINNLASLFVLTAKGAMLGWKKLTGTSLIR